MKKELSFYEFVGILIPGIMLLFFSELIIEFSYGQKIIDLSKIGETIIFIVVAYGTGHIIHAIGNIYENVFWKIFGGMPTQWLTKKNIFDNTLFDIEQTEKIRQKIYQNFGQKEGKNYGMDIYTVLSVKQNITEKRIDIFNANYSLFRGLTITFLLLSILSFYFLGWKPMSLFLVSGLLANYRMFRFAKYYAIEVYRTYLTLS